VFGFIEFSQLRRLTETVKSCILIGKDGGRAYTAPDQYYYSMESEEFHMKKFFAEFKEFIARGDVVNMAVGIVVGSTFTAIVNSLVKDIITPFIGVLMGGANFSELSWTIGEASIMYGSFIQAVLNFLITAFVLFCVVKAMNTLKKLGEKKKAEEEAAKAAEPAAPAPTPEDIVLLTEIRDLLKK